MDRGILEGGRVGDIVGEIERNINIWSGSGGGTGVLEYSGGLIEIVALGGWLGHVVPPFVEGWHQWVHGGWVG